MKQTDEGFQRCRSFEDAKRPGKQNGTRLETAILQAFLNSRHAYIMRKEFTCSNKFWKTLRTELVNDEESLKS